MCPQNAPQKRAPPNDPLTVLALGAGVQTTALFLMSMYHQYPHPDAVIFADPGWELPSVYRNVQWLKEQADSNQIPFHVINTGNIRQDALSSHVGRPPDDPQRWASMPLFTLDVDGHKGMLRRQCTGQYKIRPMDAWIRKNLLGLAKHAKCPRDRLHLWLGISTDEPERAKASAPGWKKNCYPLMDLNISRHDCHIWLDDHGIHHPAKSSCVGCPYRNNVEWQWMQQHQPAAFQDACDFDAAIRNPTRLAAKLFLHQKRIPLEDVDFNIAPNEINAHPWATDCTGYCGT